MSKENLEEDKDLKHYQDRYDYHDEKANKFLEKAGNAEERALHAMRDRKHFDYQWHTKVMEKYDRLASRHDKAAEIAAKMVAKLKKEKIN